MATFELYERTYRQANRFSFGRNWQDFLNGLTPERIALAERSLIDFLGSSKSIKGRTFVDIGCGSGIFSLAAYRLGAKKVVSVDVDRYSLKCARSLHRSAGSPKHWTIVSASALESKLRTKLGQFDIVYSWGVLHHTGNMDAALANATRLVKPGGVLYIAIYNHSRSLAQGRSELWQRIKRAYNQAGRGQKRLYYYLYATYLFLGLALSGINPLKYQRSYQSARGMSYRHDVLDWLGGYPYEYASPQSIINRLGQLGFACRKLVERTGIGCNEYLFTRTK